MTLSSIQDENQSTLIHLIAKGDEDAFRRLFDIYYQKLFHVALFFLRTKESAEEAVADVFFTLWKKKEYLPEIEDINSYLYISVKNQALQYIRRASHVDESEELYTIEFITDNENPESDLLNKEYTNLIQAAISSLPEKCREVFRLSLADKLTHKQIAQLLGISEKTVEAHKANAYKKIAQFVNKKYSEKKINNFLSFFF